jgi:hypothetical protein
VATETSTTPGAPALDSAALVAVLRGVWDFIDAGFEDEHASRHELLEEDQARLADILRALGLDPNPDNPAQSA